MTKEQFWERVEKTDGCWNWNGASFNSHAKYGGFWFEQKWKRAHVLSALWSLGPKPEGHFVCHHCDNPSCVRPDHLFYATPLQNTRDAIAKGRFFNPNKRNPCTCKLNPELARQIKAATGRQRTIAARFGVHQSTVSDIKTGKHWRNA